MTVTGQDGGQEPWLDGEREWLAERLSALLSQLDEVDQHVWISSVFDVMREQMRLDGLEPQDLEVVGRRYLVCRVPASRPAFAAGQRQALLISACLEPDRPYSTETAAADPVEQRDHLIARGGILAAFGVVMVAALRRWVDAGRFETARDLVLSIEVVSPQHNGVHGTEQVDPEQGILRGCAVALADGGGHAMKVGDRSLVTVAVAQKAAVWLRLLARGDGAEPVLPEAEGALGRLLGALERISTWPLPWRASASARAQVQATAASQGVGRALVLRGLLNSATYGQAIRRLGENERRSVHALFHDTITLTQVHGGSRPDSCPIEATATLDCRLVPGRTTTELVAELRAVIGDAIEVEVLGERRGVQSPCHAPMFGIIKEIVEQRESHRRVVPTMVAGSCDALAWRQVAVPAFGFVPVQGDEQVDFGGLWQRGAVPFQQAAVQRGLETFAEVVVRFLVEG